MSDNKPAQRDEYDIREDVRAIKRAICVFKDKDRLEDAKKEIKSKKAAEQSLDALVDGDIKTALGF